MTQMLEFKCRKCKKTYGKLGVPIGHAVVVCHSCRDFMVVSDKSGPCPKCEGACRPFGPECPSCGSKDLYFRDLSFPEPVRVWMRCKSL